MPAGRPRKYDTPEEMQDVIDEFFDVCDAKEEPYTITGLALALGFCSRQALINYEGRPEYHDTVKRAKLRVEQYAEKKLFGNSPTGAIFALKNYQWSDKVEQEISGPGGRPIEIEGSQRPQLTKEEWLQLHGLKALPGK